MTTQQQELAAQVDAELRRLGYQVYDHRQISTREFVFQFSLEEERGWLYLILEQNTVYWLPTREIDGKLVNWLYCAEEELPWLLKQLRAMGTTA